MKILMVCLGNICRSPLAEGILRAKAKGLDLDWKIDSAGTGSWHVCNKPDPRSIAVANQHEIDISYDLLTERLYKLKDDIIDSENKKPLLGGIYQDKICAAMLFNNTFQS